MSRRKALEVSAALNSCARGVRAPPSMADALPNDPFTDIILDTSRAFRPLPPHFSPMTNKIKSSTKSTTTITSRLSIQRLIRSWLRSW